MILNDLTIRNFRLLENFSVPKLGNVNLIVGKNNSGKSSVLEALRIFSAQGDLSLLGSIISGHDENLRSDIDFNANVDDTTDYSYRHLFSGREYPRQDNVEIFIGNKEKSSYLTIEHRFVYDQIIEETDASTTEVIRRRRRVPVSKQDLFANDLEVIQGLFISSKGTGKWLDLVGDSYARRMRPAANADANSIPCSFVPTRYVDMDALAEMWDKVALIEQGRFVVKALQTIESSVEGIAFVKKDVSRSGYPSRDRSESRTAILKIAGIDRPVPLNSMGDGMLRVLQLILAIFPARGGFFVIDEFENGLHYAVQEKIWQLVFDLARELNIQVFATTHSWDCIDAFSSVASQSDGMEGMLFRVGRSIVGDTAGHTVATVFASDQLARLTKGDVELR